VNAESCASATLCMAVGYYYDSQGNELNLAESWDGTGWTLQSSSNPAAARSSYLNAVSCTAANACTAQGYYYNTLGTKENLTETWDGTTWTVT
jgi:hypothetical protein